MLYLILLSTLACGLPAGKVIEVGEDIKVACGKGIISILAVVPEGKGRMSAADFVRGRKIAEGDILG